MKRYFRHNDGRTYPWSPHLEAAKLSYLTLVEEQDNETGPKEVGLEDILGAPTAGVQVVNLKPVL